MIPLRESTTAEKPLQASKWLDAQTLLSKNELEALFQFLEEAHGGFHLFHCGVVCGKEQGEISKEDFLKAYEGYIQSLMNGQLPDLARYRVAFSAAMTLTPDPLFTIPVGEDRRIIRIAKPVIQVQAHNMSYSSVDKKFHPMVFGIDSIAWGIQFSYPQLFLDNTTREVEMVKNNKKFPNGALFQSLQKWVRQHTVPTPFMVEDNQINVPIRLGKECLDWINRHPQLVQSQISVKIHN